MSDDDDGCGCGGCGCFLMGMLCMLALISMGVCSP